MYKFQRKELARIFKILFNLIVSQNLKKPKKLWHSEMKIDYISKLLRFTYPRVGMDSFCLQFINYLLRITKDQRKKAAAFPRAFATRPSVKSKSVASCSGYEIAFLRHFSPL